MARRMSVRWNTCLLVVLVLISTVNSKFDLETPVRLAHCRASCMYKFKDMTASDSHCRQSSHCSQCWKSCSILQTTSIRDLHCKRKECGPGCLAACQFHPLPPSPVSAVPLDEVLVVNQSRVSWPYTPGHVVYVVMVDGSQLCQTLQHSVTLTSTVDPVTVRVLVVDWRGLVKVLSHVAESPIDQALYILRSLGMEDKVPEESHIDLDNETAYLETTINQEDAGDVLLVLCVKMGPLFVLNVLRKANNEKLKEKDSLEDGGVLVRCQHQCYQTLMIRVDSSWRITLLSLHPEPSLVLAQISWEPYHDHLRNSQVNASYLVSWAAEGDVVRGNLLTNTSVVTLSLWLDTTYTIKVALFSLETPSIQSEPMVLDTHGDKVFNKTSQPSTSGLPEAQDHARPADDPHPYTGIHQERRHQERGRAGVGTGKEVAAGVSAAVIVFLGVVLTATWRWRHRLYLPHNKLLDEEADAPNIYRVFPPVMRLMGDSDRSELFSSRDNLLQHQ